MRNRKEISERYTNLKNQLDAILEGLEDLRKQSSINSSELMVGIIKAQLRLSELGILAWILGKDNPEFKESIKSLEEMLKRHIRKGK